MTSQAWHLLRATSRSFYLSLRALPRRVRNPIGLAYLLARSTDTVADTRSLPVSERLQTLQRMADQIQGRRPPSHPVLEPERLTEVPSPERQLLLHWPRTLVLLEMLEPHDRTEVRTVLARILEGQQADLVRFGAISPGTAVEALPTAADLEHYAYCVAGCVGEFWTRVCQRHLFPQVAWEQTDVLRRAVEFGKGLQLVNILRDLATDLRQGRCYLPRQQLQEVGLSPADLLQPNTWDRLQPCYEQWRQRALKGLDEGWQYTLMLPRAQVRLRLACAWPLLIGARTLAALRHSNPLDPAQRVKVPRAEVRTWIARTVLLYPWPGIWARLFPRARR